MTKLLPNERYTGWDVVHDKGLTLPEESVRNMLFGLYIQIRNFKNYLKNCLIWSENVCFKLILKFKHLIFPLVTFT